MSGLDSDRSFRFLGFWRSLGRSAKAAPEPAPATSRRIAVLIDADNVSYRVLDPLFHLVHAHGRATIKRAYGDWSSTRLAPWKPHLHRHGTQPVHQCQHVPSKNSSDVALVIDAMDLLHSHRLDGFCLVSSDSDFTRLAHRLREEGLWVMGCGSRATPAAMVAACDLHLQLEQIITPPAAAPAPARVARETTPRSYPRSSWPNCCSQPTTRHHPSPTTASP